MSRLSQLAQNLTGTTHDLILGLAYNPASQIVTNSRSNDLFSFTALANQNVSDAHNGLNQIVTTGGTSVSHAARGNVSAIGSASYAYSSENLMTSAPGSVALGYDPAMRLHQAAGGGTTTRFLYDGATMIAEYNGSNALQRRYVHGPGVDEPLVWYEGTGTTDRRWLHADERGSIVAISNGSGVATNLNSYDEYGIPGSTNVGRFQYTGQAWIPELGMYHYRARTYSPTLGRFLQTDPIGYEDGMNLYAYVGNDPVNFQDPAGTDIRNRESICGRAGDPCTINGMDQDVLATEVQRAVSSWVASVGAGLEEPSGAGKQLSPLNDTDRAQVLSLLQGRHMRAKMEYAWEQTLITGREHGFFIWMNQADNRTAFTIGRVWTGTEDAMGWQFGVAANYYSRRSPFFATFHTHPGTHPGVELASDEDVAFGRRYNSILIIRSREGLIDGR